MDLENKNKKPTKLAELEALLFQYGEPLEIKRIAKFLNIKEEACAKLLDDYTQELESENRGLVLLRESSKTQLATKPELEEITIKLVKDEFREELTPATLEVLTIIAYLGPIKRTDIDFIRGVNSSYSIRNLLMRSLLEREKQGNTYLYQASFDFLKHMGLKNVTELPEYENYKNILEEYEVTS